MRPIPLLPPRRWSVAVLLLPLLLLASCKQEKTLLPALFGQWQGTKWFIEDKPADVDAGEVLFEFKPDGSYTARYGEQAESGTWYTEGNKLYTTATGRAEIVTQFQQAGDGELKIEMNRGGRRERLELIKK
jgi:hypothetical protein